MKRSYLAVLLVVLSGLLSIGCTEPHPDGILPKGYEWAYGFWEGEKQDGMPVVSLYIGDYYIQYNEPFIRGAGIGDLVKDELPPIYCFPMVEYTVGYKEVPSKEVKQSDDSIVESHAVDDSEITLDFAGAFYYDQSITLKKKDKCVPGMTRVKMDVSEETIERYSKRYEQSSVWGDWKTAGRRYDRISLFPDQAHSVITNDGRYLLTLDGAYRIDGDNSITRFYSDTESWQTRSLYRYDAKKELEARIARLSFSRMWDAGRGTMLIAYEFDPNHRGRSILYSVDFWKRELTRQEFKWEAVDESTIRVSPLPVSEYTYEDFKVVDSGWSIYIVGEDGVKFTLGR